MNNKRFKILADNVLFTQLDEEGVLYDTHNNSYLRMNETFCLIFKKIEEGKGVNEIKSDLMQIYSVDEETCSSQIQDSINTLLDKEYIIEVED